MIRVCYICWKVMGEKEPFENKEKTGGICDDCFPGELEKIRKRKEERKKQIEALYVGTAHTKD